MADGRLWRKSQPLPTKYPLTAYCFLSLQGHHDHSLWAIHLIRGSIWGSERHVFHGQRSAFHHEVDRRGRYVYDVHKMEVIPVHGHNNHRTTFRPNIVTQICRTLYYSVYSMILACSTISWFIMVSEKEKIQSGWYLSIDLFYYICNFYGLSPFTFAQDIDMNCMYWLFFTLVIGFGSACKSLLDIEYCNYRYSIIIIQCHANCLNDTSS